MYNTVNEEKLELKYYEKLLLKKKKDTYENSKIEQGETHQVIKFIPYPYSSVCYHHPEAVLNLRLS